MVYLFRKVDTVHLTFFRLGLERLKENQSLKAVEKLIKYYDKHILQEEKADKNMLKKMIYALMTRYKKLGNFDKSKIYYDLYQNLKNNKIDYDQAFKEFMDIN